MWLLKTGDPLIQGTTKADLTVYIYINLFFSNITSETN